MTQEDPAHSERTLWVQFVEFTRRSAKRVWLLGGVSYDGDIHPQDESSKMLTYTQIKDTTLSREHISPLSRGLQSIFSFIPDQEEMEARRLLRAQYQELAWQRVGESLYFALEDIDAEHFDSAADLHENLTD